MNFDHPRLRPAKNFTHFPIKTGLEEQPEVLVTVVGEAVAPG